jgi:O-antigen/teichoic acid export membrane protein
MVNRLVKFFLKSQFNKHLAFSYTTQAVVLILGFLQLFIINKYYGVEVFGQLTIIMATIGVFSSLVTARSSEAVTKFFKIELIRRNHENAKFIISVGLFVDLITAIILVSLVYLFANFMASYFLKDETFSDEIIICSFSAFFMFLRGFIVGFLQAKELFYKVNAITLVDWMLRMFFLVLFVFYLDWLTLKDIIYSLLFASFFSFIYALLVFLKYYFEEFKGVKFQYNQGLLGKYWSFSIKTFFSSSLKAGNLNVDNLILAYFLNPQIVGIYQTLKKILSPIGLASIPFSTLIYPRFIRNFELKSNDKIVRDIKKVSLFLFTFAIFYIVISFTLLEDVFDFMNVIFIQEYQSYFVLIAIFSILIALQWWVRIFSNTVNPNYSIYMNLFSTIYQLSVVVYFVNMFGIVGLIASVIPMHLIIYLYYLLKLKKVL